MDTKYIERLAKSAKLKFTPDNVHDWSVKMESIFTWLDELARVDTSSLAEDNLKDPLITREDKAVIFPDRERIISSFAEEENKMAKVKKVL